MPGRGRPRAPGGYCCGDGAVRRWWPPVPTRPHRPGWRCRWLPRRCRPGRALPAGAALAGRRTGAARRRAVTSLASLTTGRRVCSDCRAALTPGCADDGLALARGWRRSAGLALAAGGVPVGARAPTPSSDATTSAASPIGPAPLSRPWPPWAWLASAVNSGLAGPAPRTARPRLPRLLRLPRPEDSDPPEPPAGREPLPAASADTGLSACAEAPAWTWSSRWPPDWASPPRPLP